MTGQDNPSRLPGLVELVDYCAYFCRDIICRDSFCDSESEEPQSFDVLGVRSCADIGSLYESLQVCTLVPSPTAQRSCVKYREADLTSSMFLEGMNHIITSFEVHGHECDTFSGVSRGNENVRGELTHPYPAG